MNVTTKNSDQGHQARFCNKRKTHLYVKPTHSISPDSTWGDRIDSDIFISEVISHTSGHGQYCSFGSRVGPAFGHTIMTSYARHVYNTAKVSY